MAEIDFKPLNLAQIYQSADTGAALTALIAARGTAVGEVRAHAGAGAVPGAVVAAPVARARTPARCGAWPALPAPRASLRPPW